MKNTILESLKGENTTLLTYKDKYQRLEPPIMAVRVVILVLHPSKHNFLVKDGGQIPQISKVLSKLIRHNSSVKLNMVISQIKVLFLSQFLLSVSLFPCLNAE